MIPIKPSSLGKLEDWSHNGDCLLLKGFCPEELARGLVQP